MQTFAIIDILQKCGSIGVRQLLKTECIQKDHYYYERLGQSMIEYARLFEQQQHILEDRKYYEALCAGLQRMKKISKVVVNDDDYDWDFVMTAEEPAPAMKPSAWSMIADDAGCAHDWNYSVVTHLLQAVADSCSGLEELQIGSSTSSSPTTVFGTSALDVERTCSVARCLESINLHLVNTECYNRDDWYPGVGVRHVLAQAQQLQRLSVEGRLDASFLVGPHWPHLSLLDLENLECEADDLVSMLRTHKATIRHLSLRNFSLSGQESWEETGKRIGKFIELDCLRLCSLAEGQWWLDLDKNANMALAHSLMQSVPRDT